MSSHPLLSAIRDLRAFAVIRTATADQAVAVGSACVRGGIRLLEITLTVDGALAAVKTLSAQPGAIVGIGSVTAPAQVRAGAEAGASFAVSPHFDADILAAAKARGLLCAMGGVTPTEAMTCHRAGVDMVKVFPASSFGGPAHVKALLDPLPFLRLMPTGGVDLGNIRAYLDAGAAGLGLGGSLVDRDAVAAGDWGRVEAAARKVVGIVDAWRAGKAA
jgi:2-dehydro-3-deoxyphosphogluconate aldolase / (4S)-4-hydroxy-2-oxoglutarate aldolase